MKLSDWFRLSKRVKGVSGSRLSDSVVLSGDRLGDSEKSLFVSVWTDSKVLDSWKTNKLNRI